MNPFIPEWAPVKEALEKQLAPAAKSMLAVAYGVKNALTHLTDRYIITGRKADDAAKQLESLLATYSGLAAVRKLTKYREFVEKSFADNAQLRNTLPEADTALRPEAELLAGSRSAHWAIVNAALQESLPDVALNIIRVAYNLMGVSQPLDEITPSISSEENSIAVPEGECLKFLLSQYSGRPEVGMLNGYVRRLFKEAYMDGPKNAPITPGADRRKTGVLPQAVIDAEAEALFIERDGSFRSALRRPIPYDASKWLQSHSAVGRVNAKGAHIGTAWHIGNNLVVTAAHVASAIFNPAPGTGFQPGLSTDNALIDFGTLPGGHIANLVRLKAIGQSSTSSFIYRDDVAVMEIGWPPGTVPQGGLPALELASALPALAPQSPLAVVGFPAAPLARQDEDQMRAHACVFGTKRFQPGKLMRLDHLLWHTCSTLVGNSGSPVFSPSDPTKVIGLHVGADIIADSNEIYNVAVLLDVMKDFVSKARTN